MPLGAAQVMADCNDIELTATTACVTGSPRNAASASRLIFCSKNADNCSGVNSRSRSRMLPRSPIFGMEPAEVPARRSLACSRPGPIAGFAVPPYRA